MRIPAVVAALAMLCGGCSMFASNDDIKRKVDRDFLNRHITACNGGAAMECMFVGDALARRTANTRQLDWHDPYDPAGARQAYDKCCAAGQGLCCRAIAEMHLAPGELLSFGDGYVEIENTKEAGGVAVGVGYWLRVAACRSADDAYERAGEERHVAARLAALASRLGLCNELPDDFAFRH